MKKRYFLVLSFLGLWPAARWVPTNRVTVVNESGQTAHAVWIEVNDETTDLGDIPAGGSASAWFLTPRHEDSVGVRGRLAGGAAVDEPSCVYVVWEEYFCHFVVVIREDGSVGRRW